MEPSASKIRGRAGSFEQACHIASAATGVPCQPGVGTIDYESHDGAEDAQNLREKSSVPATEGAIPAMSVW